MNKSLSFIIFFLVLVIISGGFLAFRQYERVKYQKIIAIQNLDKSKIYKEDALFLVNDPSTEISVQDVNEINEEISKSAEIIKNRLSDETEKSTNDSNAEKEVNSNENIKNETSKSDNIKEKESEIKTDIKSETKPNTKTNNKEENKTKKE